jgi:arylsulfatase A-like enzyme
VPLLIILPGRGQLPEVVRETVSLRDLPATIADLVGMAKGAPFPGASLARLRRSIPPEGASGIREIDGAISELSSPNPTYPSQGRSPAARGSLISLAEGEYVYIRNEGDGREQLFHESVDPEERVNLARVDAMRPRLERLRRRLDQMRRNESSLDRMSHHIEQYDKDVIGSTSTGHGRAEHGGHARDGSGHLGPSPRR